jgi:hypothetical protein
MNEYFIFLWSLIGGGLIVLSGLTLLDFLIGVIVAVIAKNFKWEYLMHYLQSDVLPIFGWVVIVILTTIPEGLVPPGGALPVASGVVYASVFLGIMASILGSLADAGVLQVPLNKIGIGKMPEADKPQ